MNYNQSNAFPQVFHVDVDRGPQFAAQPPAPVPCWSFPPAQQMLRSQGKSRGGMGVSPGLVMLLLFILLLVFAALGLGAYQIHKLQAELSSMRQEINTENKALASMKQVGARESELNGKNTDRIPAAHVIGQSEKQSHRTLQWESGNGRAFTTGGVVYHPEDGGLQVNDTGLYHIYSRVEFLFDRCSSTDSLAHSVFVRRTGDRVPLRLMEGDKAGFCRPNGHVWTTESYLGSILQLKEKDRVFVNVSHPGNLRRIHNANFFGLYKI